MDFFSSLHDQLTPPPPPPRTFKGSKWSSKFILEKNSKKKTLNAIFKNNFHVEIQNVFLAS